MKPLGLVDGKLIDLTENVVSMEDRGYQFGDGVYEMTRVYHGNLFAFQAHIERLYRSLRALRIPAVWTEAELAECHQMLIQESGIQNAGIYLQITRGTAPRIHHFPENIVPKLTMSIRPVSAATANLRQVGAKVIFTADERWLRCDIKSLNLLGNIMAKQKAKEAGCFEALLVRDGKVTEGTSSTFFVVKGGVLWTHPVNSLILQGVTRSIVIDKIAHSLGLPVVEKPFDTGFAKAADEAFLSGTMTEIMPVVAMDGTPVGSGTVGDITNQIQEAYITLINRQCQ